jgi:SAM-dependent methyltransferase
MRPIDDAVNIPAGELAERTHELPPRPRGVRVADTGTACAEAGAWLETHGRVVEIIRDFAYATDGKSAPPGRLWSPSAFLAEIAARVKNELEVARATVGASHPHGSARVRALDVACGTGRDAVYLASLVWDVTATDILPDALARGAALEARYGAMVRPIRWLCADFEVAAGPMRLEPAVERLAFEDGFDLICVVRYLHRPLFPHLVGWLAPGGSLVYETFTTTHRQRHEKPARDAHVLQPGELRALAGALRVREYSEGWREDSSHTARLWAVRA